MHRLNKGQATRLLMLAAFICLLFALACAHKWFGLAVDPVKPALLGFLLWCGAETL